MSVATSGTLSLIPHIAALMRATNNESLAAEKFIMTLIAHLSIDGRPLFIGDVLLSSGTRTGLKVNLPLVGDINEIIGQRGLPFQVKFSQKINLLGDQLAVAWCGSAFQAERVLRRLAILASSNGVTSADIEAEFNSIDRDQVNEVQLVGLLVRDTDGTTVEASRFSWGINGVEVLRLGPVYAAGSGREAFLALLKKRRFHELRYGK